MIPSALLMNRVPFTFETEGLLFNSSGELWEAVVEKDGLKGWKGSPGVRREDTPRLGAHGNFSERGWREGRLVTLEGELHCATSAVADEMEDTLAALLGDGQMGKLTITENLKAPRWANAYLASEVLVERTGDLVVPFQVQFACPDPRKYGTPSSSSTGSPILGGGLQFDLFAGESRVARTNLCTNPSFELATTGWVGARATLARSSAFPQMAKSGSNVLQVTSSGTSAAPYARMDNLPVEAGQWMGLKAFLASEIASTNTQVRIFVSFRDSGDVQVGWAATPYEIAPFPTGAVHQLTAQAPANTAKYSIYLQFQNGAAPAQPLPSGRRLWADVVQSFTGETQAEVQAMFDAPYYDGSTPATPDAEYSWAGEAHASASIERMSVGGASYGVLDFGAAGDPGTTSFTNVGTADSAALLRVDGYAPGFTITELGTGNRLVYTAAVPVGSYVLLNPVDGSVLLDGYADRSGALEVREWTRTPAKGTSVFLFESKSPGARLTVEGTPAWW